MEQKKYNKIEQKINSDFLQDGVTILIQEKIDGANASFRKDDDGNLRVFSRNTELDEDNNLGGYYQWAIENINPKDLNPNTIYFGEWTNKHKIDYGENEKKFYLFDVYVDSTSFSQYMPFSFVEYWAEKLNLNLVPVFYHGEYQSIEHVKSFLGQTKLNGKIGEEEQGEGIVIKRYEYKDRFEKQQHYKMVTKKFSEKKKGVVKEKYNATPETIFTNKFVTEQRVEKNLFKLFDEGILKGDPYELEYTDLGKIMKSLVLQVKNDILEEESSFFEKDYSINLNVLNKALGGIVSKYVRSFIDKKNEEKFDKKEA